MKTIKFLTLSIFVCLLLSSCSDNKTEKNWLENLTYEEVQTGKTIDDCDTTKDCTSIYFYYPVFKNENQNPLIDSLNNFVMGKLLIDEIDLDSTANLDTVVNNFIEDYKIQLKDFPDHDFPWYSKTRASVVYQNEKYLTLKISNENYTGGAHPNSFTNYYTINKTNAKEISLKELFKPGFEKELNDIVAKEFRKVRGITSNKDLNEEGFWFEDNQNIFNDNFGLTEKGIIFYYNPYDVAPYSYGPTVVEVPYSEISDISNF